MNEGLESQSFGEAADFEEKFLQSSPCLHDLDFGDPAVRMWVTLIGRAECHLCDVAYEQVVRALMRIVKSPLVEKALGPAETWLRLVVRDIDDHPDLAGRFSYEIPVVLLNGSQHCYWQVNQDRLVTDVLRRMGAGGILEKAPIEAIKPKSAARRRAEARVKSPATKGTSPKKSNSGPNSRGNRPPSAPAKSRQKPRKRR